MERLDNSPETPVNAQYGAPLGRRSDPLNCIDGSLGSDWRPFTLRRVRINGGGYDEGGAYWGLGQPLFYYQADSVTVPNEDVSGYLRASSREAAIAKIREACPDARFKRGR